MFLKFLNKLIGDHNSKVLKKIYPIVDKIKKVYAEYETTITDQNAVLAKTGKFKERLKNGETVDDLLPEAFALVKIACTHLKGKSWPVREKEVIWEMVPYDVQLIGGIVLHQGNIAEMKTGEGKTLVCTLPIYLNALTEKGVFLVTVNDYLAHRDSEWMGGLYNYLGLSVGCVVHGQSQEEKKAAYNCDITYGTNNEFGFDYLRDNMVTNAEELVQRNLFYAIVDEVDSILIDEARTPLIISAPAEESTSKYQQYSRLVSQLQPETHYKIDEKLKTATLTEEGIAKMEQLLGLENIYTEAGFAEVHHIEQALRAQACYKADVDYMVTNGEIIIIDEFTGRLMQGRRYSSGLHQAIEAKEKVEVKRESKTLATVSFQNYFRLFDKLAGMTGTAATESEEFYRIYGLDTITIPTHRPIQRRDTSDVIYKTQKGKFLSIVEKVKELHAKGQPVLLGTISVEKSEVLSQLLKLEGVKHNVLNAKYHEKEAEIVAEAGQKGAVTIATNMAGRGTDIKLGEGVTDLGGLFILGSERHEARRIDNQLRGRSGRQGDPGESQFFISMEDDLMRLFGADRIKKMMDVLKVPEDMPITNGIISRSIESAQKKVEGHHFDIRKHLVEYDDVMNIHRNVIYKKRQKFLKKEDSKEDILEMISELAEGIVMNHTEARARSEWNITAIFDGLIAVHKDEKNPPERLRSSEPKGEPSVSEANTILTVDKLRTLNSQQELLDFAKKYLLDAYDAREKSLPNPTIMRQIERSVFLRSNDALWMDHIDSMTQLRENVAFSGYAQKDPLVEYKSQSYDMFMEMLALIRANTVNTLFKIDMASVAPAQIIVQPEEVRHMRTNEAEVESALTKEDISVNDNVTHSSFGHPSDSDNPVIVKIRANEPHKVSHTQNTQNSNQSTQTPNYSDIGRNDPCPCGSGKKFKKCHGNAA
ncbi:preprotein translocase subunit SecA [Candidatus Peregrinibacteria bacterium]|nr:preprotein translocase subunit SecA [Candidatus Peregrinibacteria bacterium]